MVIVDGAPGRDSATRCRGSAQNASEV